MKLVPGKLYKLLRPITGLGLRASNIVMHIKSSYCGDQFENLPNDQKYKIFLLLPNGKIDYIFSGEENKLACGYAKIDDVTAQFFEGPLF